MKIHSTILLLCISLFSALNGQVKTVAELMKLKPKSIAVQKYDSTMAVYVPMGFNSSQFLNTHQIKKIPDVSWVYAVHLVYTRFREVDTFDQPALNAERFRRLEEVYPEVFRQPDIEWQVLEQRKATTKEQAATYFHGFVIYLKNVAPPELVGHELETISSVIDSYKDTIEWVPEVIVWKVKKRKVATGMYLPRNSSKRKSGVRYSSSSLGLRDPEYDIIYDSTIHKKTGGYWKKTGSFDTTLIKSSHEFDLLTRRKWSPKMAVVADVTGSMSPYSTQVMLWLKYSPKTLENGRFAFFNDGDAMPDIFKRVGNTGGIYFAGSGNFDSVYSVMSKAMRRGLGGDQPENNLEAVLKTLDQWPDIDTILMIADNEAKVKDLELLPKIKKPVSIMVCGVQNAINPDYINIARSTGGRIFVLNKEIYNLKNIPAGERIILDGKIFEWRKGTFVRID